ncbi:hypothetical protein TrVGV298_007859 [Trichoderma virens]|nr:hypothetical protein TrVGV298_007859 [Trichoderma virens]
MAVVALVTSGDRRIYALPGQLADVEKVYGGEYGDEEDEDDVPGSMRLPNELLQQIYRKLSPGGWWSSMLAILSPMRTVPASNLSREDIMSKWIARECNLLNWQKSAFVEVGHTDFSAIVPGSVPGDLRGGDELYSVALGAAVSSETGDAVGAAEACDEGSVSPKGYLLQYGYFGGEIFCGIFDGGEGWYGV